MQNNKIAWYFLSNLTRSKRTIFQYVEKEDYDAYLLEKS